MTRSFECPVDPAAVTALIEAAALTEIRPRFGRLKPEEIREKGPNDLVTVADLAMERILSAELLALLPGSLVVGEEAVALDPAIEDLIAEDEWVWIIDPVDGTSNFAAGKPTIAVIVALARAGRTVAGWIHDPIGGGTAHAVLGQGAWRDGEPLSVTKPPSDYGEMKGSYNARYFPDDIRRSLETQREAFRSSRSLFCAGQEYLRLAEGDLHFVLFARLKPWDHAAGVLLHQEAGGYSARLDGSTYGPTHRDGGLLLTSDEKNWRRLRDFLIG